MIIVDRTELAIWKGSGWPHGPPQVIKIHSTRGGQPNRRSLDGHDLEMSSTTNWFQNLNSRASANLIVSPREIVRCVSDDSFPWDAKEHSAWGPAIELTQSLSTDPYYDAQYRQAAYICREYNQMFGIPMVYIPDFSNGMKGITGHDNTVQGRRDGKTDPGDEFDWDKFMRLCRGEDMAKEKEFKLFHTWSPAKLWIIEYSAEVPLWRRWIVTAPGATKLIQKHGIPMNTTEANLRSIPEVRPWMN